MSSSGAADWDRLDDTAHVGITRLLAAYADTVTRRAWNELIHVFRPDCQIQIDTVTRPVFMLTGPDELGRFVGDAVERFDFFEFVVLNVLSRPHPDGDPDRALARVHMCEIRRLAASEEWSTAYGRYDDDLERVDGRWWFAGRRYRSLGRTGADGGVFPIPAD
ncbi:MAG: nuclear transport factor 2 family protein [Actinomycetota bacterium]